MEPSQSSRVANTVYDVKKKELTVHFDVGGSVTHHNVGDPAYQAFIHAENRTAHYRKHIEPVYMRIKE